MSVICFFFFYILCFIFFFFFFSSRRRHTRWNCDWSSDVCSSDLRRVRFRPLPGSGSFAGGHRGRRRSPIPPPARRCPHPLPDRTQDEAARSARAPVRSWAGSSGGIVQGKVGAQNRGGQLHSSPVQISGSPSSPSGG